MTMNNWIGQVLSNRYRIEELIGSGGMSSVYKATDPNLRRVVAIKMIHAHLSDNAEFARRFEEEATVVAQLRHPNIVQVYDFNTDGSTSYMVMEFVPGETLQTRLKRLNAEGRRMDYSEAVRFAIHICEAADYAHKRGMIHRDIKPANVMLDVQGQAILMDFGIAKIIGGHRHTATGAVIGTALYMSPEQIRGEQIDPRTDVYSIGVTLFEMVNGRPPYEADSAMTLMMKHLNDPIPDLRQLQPDIPDELVAVIEKSLSKARESRFQSAIEMSMALQAVLERMVKRPATDFAPVEKTLRVPSAASYAQGAQAPHQDIASKRTQPMAGFEAVGVSNTDPEEGWMRKDQIPRIPSPAPKNFFHSKAMMILGSIVVILAFIVGGVFLFADSGRGNGEGVLQEAQITETAKALALLAQVTQSATHTMTATFTPDSPTATALPTETPTLAFSPTPTIPPGIPYVLITSITLAGDTYVVEYETFEYVPQLPGVHIHFFFNTVLPAQAGVPGAGPWILYGGPNPFTGYRTIQRPAEATMMCALVANPNHSIQLNSGNCFPLPDVAQPTSPATNAGNQAGGGDG